MLNILDRTNNHIDTARVHNIHYYTIALNLTLKS